MVSVFGDKIHRFEGNVSEMKQLAGHDFEYLLQVRDHFGVEDMLSITTP